MPPKKQITRKQIMDKAFEMVKINGCDSLTARNLASELRCSTQPIYKEFVDMNDLKTTLSQRASQIMIQYVKSNSKEYQNPILSKVLGYVQFANEEKYLFQLMFTGDNQNKEKNAALAQINSELELNMIVYAHGIIMMKAFGTLELTWDQIREMIIKAFKTFENGEMNNEN